MRFSVRLLITSSSIAALVSATWAAEGDSLKCLGKMGRSDQTQQEQPEVSYGVEQDMQQPFKYIGNRYSSKFHRPGCIFAKIMSPRKAVLLHYRRQAIEAGLKPCRWCLPATWTCVKAKLLPKGNLSIRLNSHR